MIRITCAIKNFFLCLVVCLVFAMSVNAEIIERIVAIVNDQIILESEFTKTYKAAKERENNALQEDILNEMINKLLLLKEAKRFKLDSSPYEEIFPVDDDALIREYIDIRLRGFIHIAYDDIEYYYYANEDLFSGKDFYDVREEIEDILMQRELDLKLIEHLEELRRNSYIRIQLRDDD